MEHGTLFGQTFPTGSLTSMGVAMFELVTWSCRGVW
jgi:hypothetical protein